MKLEVQPVRTVPFEAQANVVSPLRAVAVKGIKEIICAIIRKNIIQSYLGKNFAVVFLCHINVPPEIMKKLPVYLTKSDFTTKSRFSQLFVIRNFSDP